MFNSTYISDRTPDVNVHINQQPNDAADSARFYGELLTKAQKEVASARVLNLGANNEVTVLCVDGDIDNRNFYLKVRLLFKINGVLYDIQTNNDLFSIQKAVCKSIIDTVFQNSVKKLMDISKEARG